MSLFLVLLMLLLSKKGARSVLCANPKHLIGTCNADIAEHIAGVKTRRRSPTRSKSNEGRLLDTRINAHKHKPHKPGWRDPRTQMD